MNAPIPHIGPTLAQRRAMIDKPALASKLAGNLNTLRNEQRRFDEIDARLQADVEKADALLAAIREHDTARCATPEDDRPYWQDFSLMVTALCVMGLIGYALAPVVAHALNVIAGWLA